MGVWQSVKHFFAEQKALVGDSVDSVFNRGYAKQDRNLKAYKDRYDTDCTVGISIDTLAEMIAGSGFYITIDDPTDPVQVEMKEELERLCEAIHLDEKLLNIGKCGLIYGYVPTERVTRTGPPGGILGVKVLDPPTCTYKRDRTTGEFAEFTQSIGQPAQQITFKPFELVWWTFNEVGDGVGVKYGVSQISRIFQLLEIREQVVNNIQGIMKNQARPPVIWKVTSPNDVETLKTTLKDCRESEQDPVLYPADGIQQEVVRVDTRAPYWEYVSYIDGLIFEGLHSPLLNYLKNSTEASSKTMLESIDRHVEGIQRYMKRMVEHEVFEWHLWKKGFDLDAHPCPTFNWGKPSTALDDLAVDQFVTEGLKVGYISRFQYLDILKQIGLELPEEPTEEEQPTVSIEEPAVAVTTGTEPTEPTEPEKRNPAVVHDKPISHEPDEGKVTYVITKSTGKPKTSNRPRTK